MSATTRIDSGSQRLIVATASNEPSFTTDGLAENATDTLELGPTAAARQRLADTTIVLPFFPVLAPLGLPSGPGSSYGGDEKARQQIQSILKRRT